MKKNKAGMDKRKVSSMANEYLTKPWYIHPITISILFSLWFMVGIPLLVGVILLFVSAKDTRRKKRLAIDLNYDRVIDLAELEEQIKEKSLHDAALNTLAGVKDQYKATKATLDQLDEEIATKTAHSKVLDTLAGATSQLRGVLETSDKLQAEIMTKTEHNKMLGTMAGVTKEMNRVRSMYLAAKEKMKATEARIIEAESSLDIQEVGFYGLDFDISASTGYKAKMIELQDGQKQLIKDKKACRAADNFTYNGSLTAGKRMVRQSVKMALWSFNTHCDSVIAKVTYRNRDLSERKIMKAFEVINSNDKIAQIKHKYLELKLEELDTTFKYKEQLEYERGLLREQRDQEREDKKLEQEIARERAKIEKDETHISTELARLQTLLLREQGDKETLRDEVNRLETKLGKLGKRKAEVDYRESHAKAGYVYVISNIGAFGKDMIKIGVTRRLEPLERVNELGDASVPFRFDVHALIFSDQAYKLEKALHDRFAKHRVNQMNGRKEFFRVPLEQVRTAIVEEFRGSSVEFHMQPEAREFRQSVALLQARQGHQIAPGAAVA